MLIAGLRKTFSLLMIVFISLNFENFVSSLERVKAYSFNYGMVSFVLFLVIDCRPVLSEIIVSLKK